MSPFAGPQAVAGEASNELHLYEGTAGDDQINPSAGLEFGSLPCIVAGDGDDLIELEYGSAEGAVYGVISGGTGADTFAFRLGGTVGFGALPFPTIVDLEAGVDRLVYDISSIQGAETAEATVSFIDDYDGNPTTPPSVGIVVDNLDGEVWYFDGESSTPLLEFDADGDLQEEDVQLVETLPGCPIHLRTNNNFNDYRDFQSGELGTAFTGEFEMFGLDGQIALGSVNDDRLLVEGNSGVLCATGGDGDDTMVSQHNDFGESSDNVLVGGQGADTFIVSDDYVNHFPGSVTEQTIIGDFEPGVDTLAINGPAANLSAEVGEASILFIDDWDEDVSDLTEFRQVVVDSAQGIVYVADGEVGTHAAVVLTGQPAITTGDVTLIDGPVP